MGELSFPKHFHLLRPSEFQEVYRQGGKRKTRSFIIYRLASSLGHPRLGLSVGRRFGPAVRRNRVRRLLREAVRLNWRAWGLGGSDLVIIPKAGVSPRNLGSVTEELSSCFPRWRKRS